MVTAYTIVLCLSACFAALALSYGARRVGRLLGVKTLPPPGVFALVAALAFLVVVAAPAPLLVGALLLLGAGMIGERNYLPTIARWGVPLVAALLALSQSSMPVVAGIPHIFVQLAAMAGLFGFVMVAPQVSDDLETASTAYLAPLLPLAVAPLLFPAPGYLALDSSLIAVSLLGALLAGKSIGRMGLARAPFSLLLGWLIVMALAGGAPIAAAVSLLIFAGALAYPRRMDGKPDAL